MDHKRERFHFDFILLIEEQSPVHVPDSLFYSLNEDPQCVIVIFLYLESFPYHMKETLCIQNFIFFYFSVCDVHL